MFEWVRLVNVREAIKCKPGKRETYMNSEKSGKASVASNTRCKTDVLLL
jgi:hypothetical protein